MLVLKLSQPDPMGAVSFPFILQPGFVKLVLQSPPLLIGPEKVLSVVLQIWVISHLAVGQVAVLIQIFSVPTLRSRLMEILAAAPELPKC